MHRCLDRVPSAVINPDGDYNEDQSFRENLILIFLKNKALKFFSISSISSSVKAKDSLSLARLDILLLFCSKKRINKDTVLSGIWSDRRAMIQLHRNFAGMRPLSGINLMIVYSTHSNKNSDWSVASKNNDNNRWNIEHFYIVVGRFFANSIKSSKRLREILPNTFR